jgi:hypothetical protein
MPNTKQQKNDRVTVRLGNLHTEISRIAEDSGLKDSEIIRAALASFFSANKTPAKVIAAVIASRTKRLTA